MNNNDYNNNCLNAKVSEKKGNDGTNKNGFCIDKDMMMIK